MVKVSRGNVILEIKDDEVDRYLDLGYDVIDDNGNVIHKCIPTDLAELQKLYVEQTYKIKELTQELKKLKAKKSTKSKADI